ncbi:tetratricopeptide repeat protein [Roseibium sp.]|uniref:surface lipoprotein assembly modifier n=1 Tax=Roseibium sp. TaxID=1936156 RepID=UPI003A9783C6
MSDATVATEARQQQLLALMLQAPDDLDIAFEYATVATQNGDYEAAIGTFERMLIYAPGLARVQLELGVLYYRLGSFEAAQNYFESALQAPNVPPEVEKRVQTFLTAIEEKEDPSEFRATVITGARYQTNANAAPGGRRVSLNGGTFVLDETSTGQADLNAFVAGTLHGGYDLGTQGDLLEVDLVFYGSRYRDVVRLDTGLAELTFGPSINLKRFNFDNGRVGLYGIFSGVRLNHANYSGALGVGSRLGYQITPEMALNGKLEFRRRWYNDTAEYSSVSDRNGSQIKAALTLVRQFSGAFSGRLLLLADYEETKVDWNQSWEVGVGIGGTYRFASPIAALPYRWSLDVEAGYIRREYEGPDPIVSATSNQRDNEGWLRTTLTVPLTQDVALGLTGELRRQQSNYDLSDYSNASAMLSVMKVF